MDYCLMCRRHLNGAYSCPDCGTIADRSTVSATQDTAQLPVVETTADPGGRPDGTGADSVVPPSGDLLGPRQPYEPEPREARRRSRRATRQRVAVYGIGSVAIAGALAMFSLAALTNGSPGQTDPGSRVHDLPPPPSGSSGPVADDATLLPRSTGSSGHSPSPTATPSGSASATATVTTTKAAPPPPPTSTSASPTTNAPAPPTQQPTTTPTHSHGHGQTPTGKPTTCVLIFCS